MAVSLNCCKCPFPLHILLTSMRIYRDESDKETILMAYTVLIDHTPSLKDMMLLAIEDHKLMQWIEYHVSLYLVYFAFSCPLCTLNRSAMLPRRHIVMTHPRSSYHVSHGYRTILGSPWTLHLRLIARPIVGLITLFSPRCFVPG